MLELNTAAAFPGAPLLTVILALVGNQLSDNYIFWNGGIFQLEGFVELALYF